MRRDLGTRVNSLLIDVLFRGVVNVHELVVFMIVGENLSIPAPINHRREGLFGIMRAQMILKFGQKPPAVRRVIRPLRQDVANVRGERDAAQQMLGKQPLAAISRVAGKDLTCCGQMQGAVTHLDEAEDLGGFLDRQELVYFEMESFR